MLDIVKERRKLFNTVFRNEKRRWLGHILRGDGLVNKVIEERIEGKRGRGKPRITLLGDIKTNETYEKKNKR